MTRYFEAQSFQEGMMLVLSRKVGSRIVVAGNVEIKVVQIIGNSVRLGITAPSHVNIDRLEMSRSFDQSGSQLDKLTTGPEDQKGCDNMVSPGAD